MKNCLDILRTTEADEPNLVVLDEQMAEAGQLEETSKPFTQRSQHRNITVVYIVQNVFDKGKVHRTISQNSHYMVLFNNPRDQAQIRSLAQQVFPTQVKYFMDAYREATKKEHDYILLDSTPSPPIDSGSGAAYFNKMSWKFMPHLEVSSNPLILNHHGILSVATKSIPRCYRWLGAK